MVVIEHCQGVGMATKKKQEIKVEAIKTMKDYWRIVANPSHPRNPT